MGVLVFVMMITSLDDENAMPLMRAEVPGPEADKLVPKARHTARLLYGMYLDKTAYLTIQLLDANIAALNKLYETSSTTSELTTAQIGSYAGDFTLEHTVKINSNPCKR